MPPRVLRTKTPAGEPISADDVTQPELAPPVRKTPAASLPPPPAVRSRKETLVSPIPALLAASMGLVREDAEGHSVPTLVANEKTAPVDIDDQHALMNADEADYVVELVDSAATVPPRK